MKFCKDCKYCKREWFMPINYARCRKSPGIDVVSGKKYYWYCDTERFNETTCGKKGKNFEPLEV